MVNALQVGRATIRVFAVIGASLLTATKVLTIQLESVSMTNFDCRFSTDPIRCIITIAGQPDGQFVLRCGGPTPTGLHRAYVAIEPDKFGLLLNLGLRRATTTIRKLYSVSM